MTSEVTVRELAAALIRVFEGCRLQSYPDASPAKNWTIGFGHTGMVHGQPLGPGIIITQDEADALLEQDAAALFKMVVGRPVPQAAALVSFGYNCGAGALGRVLAGQAHVEEFTKAAGKELPGLVARRRLEAALMALPAVQST